MSGRWGVATRIPHRPDIVRGAGRYSMQRAAAESGAFDDAPLAAIPVLDQGLHVIAARVIGAHDPGGGFGGGGDGVHLVVATGVGSRDSLPGTGPSRSSLRHCGSKYESCQQGKQETSKQSDLGMTHGVPHLLLRISSRCELEHSRCMTV